MRIVFHSEIGESTTLIDMRKFYFPESVLVFGVSDRQGNLGKQVVMNLKRFGFRGAVYGFGRKEMEFEGTAVYSEMESMPVIPDVAILLVPASAIVNAIERCAAKGIKNIVIETGGFSELGPERKGLEEEIQRVATENEITCMGPNCIGVINREKGVCMPFVPFHPEEIVPGRNAFVAQSGGLVHEVVRRCSAENVGLSRITSIGNKLMLDESDLLEYHLEDTGTAVVGLYLESISSGRRLMTIASQAAKPIILLKGNASPSAREIAQFHTAALLGDEAVTAAALKQSGIQQVKSPHEMVDCFKIFSLPLMKGPKLVICSRSGGQSVLLADDAYRYGFELADLPTELFAKIGEQSKGGVIRRTNPIDLGDVFDESFYLEVLDMALSNGGVDGVVFFFDYELNTYRAFDIMKGVEGLCDKHQKPVLLCMVPDRKNWFKIRYTSSFPFFTEPERAFAALRRSLDHHLRTLTAGKNPLFPHGQERSIGLVIPASPSGIASARETLSLVQSYGVPVVEYELVRGRDEAIAAAHRIGYPLVLKQVEPAVLHKTEAGAVRLGIRNDGELSNALSEMNADLYLLQKQANMHGVETIIGGKRDGEFGPVVMFGLGGIFVEVLRDVTMRIAPVDEATAREMIDEIKGAALLRGIRGTEPVDMRALAKTIVEVSRMLADHSEIGSLDINPFVIYEEGQGGMALDVKMEVTSNQRPGASEEIGF
jgi:acetate---CoA ligase (ADP-forming)